MHNANSERLSERLSTQSIRVLNRMYLERNIYIYIYIYIYSELRLEVKLARNPSEIHRSFSVIIVVLIKTFAIISNFPFFIELKLLTNFDLLLSFLESKKG